jgi:hypothetical protein
VQDVPDNASGVHVPDAADPDQHHTYTRTKAGLFLYDHKLGAHALGRDPGHGGYFVPPVWL